MTRPQVASRSEVARGLRASVCAATPRRGSLLYRRNNVSRILAAAFAVAVGSYLPMAASAAEWFVSPSGTDSAAGTETAPFRTLTNAVARASANDIVTLLPGDHVEGFATTTVSGNSSKSRVVIDKKLTIRSKNGRASRDTTRIVGAWDTDVIANTPYGFGPNAVRCVWIDTDGSGTKLEGITFVNGSVPAYSSSNDYTAGGGVLVYGNDNTATVVDCAFIDCQAWNGGGLCYHDTKNNVQVVRCFFKGCRSSKFGFAMRGGAAYNCIFDDNGRTREKNGTLRTDSAAGASGALAYLNIAVNCTFINNETYGIGGYGTVGKAYNCLFMNNGTGSINTSYETTYTNCVNNSSLTDGNSVSVAFTTSSEVYSPYDGDYRLIAGARSLTTGNATYLSNIPADYCDTDFYGNPRTTDGVVYCGAVQDVADAAASGVAVAYTTEGDWYLDGEKLEICSRTWKAVEGWPKPRHVKFVPVDGRALLRFAFGGNYYWPLRDDTAWFTTAHAGQVQTVTPETTANIFYADPVNGSDTEGDGSEANPYKTLNKAVKKTTASFVVRAKAGDYNEGGENCGDDITTRVVVPKKLSGSLRVVAVDGPENTFISGALDPDTANGTGDNAVRCIAVASTNNYLAAFQGFTIRNGRTWKNDNNNVKSMGAALNNVDMGSSSFPSFGTAFLLDCVVTNCSGNRAGCIAGGNAYRCRFYDCRTFNGSGQCVLRYCNVVSSLFVGCGGVSQMFGNAAKGYNCTLYGSTFDSVYNNGSGVKGYLYNSVTGGRTGSYADIGESATDDQVVNTLYSCLSTLSTETFTTAVKETPLRLIDAANGDYRLATDSAGLYLASTDYLKSCMDIDGKPFVFRDGRYQAGCYAIGKGTIYVDAVNGSDANDGSSEANAFATLAAAMSAADYSDTVLALPGTYSSGTMLQTLAQSGGNVEPALPARVVVKSGVTLASRDGAAATIIQGAASTDGTAVSGCGEGAVRGVFLCKGATLRGFTVTNGHTHYGELNATTVNDYGGGVGGYYGAAATSEEFSALVEDCIITGNVACRGGGAMFGTFRNCRFTGNTLAMDKPGWAVARARLEGCFFSGNGSSGNHSSIYGCNVVNCTIMGAQADNSGVICNESSYQNTRAVLNTIVTAGKIKANVCTNCLFGSGVSNLINDAAVSGIVVADAKLDANGIPLAGSPAIDAGNNALASTALLASRDPAGTRRVLNSTIDIGAYEYDWSVPWGRAIGGKNLVVDDMPGDATLSDGRLAFSDGTVLMRWAKGSGNMRYYFRVRVTGNGTLVVKVNGEVVGTYTSADGAREIRFESGLATNALEFAYAPGDGDTGGAELFGFVHFKGLIIYFR